MSVRTAQWNFILAAVEVTSRDGSAIVFQMQLAHKRDATPITRDYITEPTAPRKAKIPRKRQAGSTPDISREAVKKASHHCKRFVYNQEL